VAVSQVISKLTPDNAVTAMLVLTCLTQREMAQKAGCSQKTISRRIAKLHAQFKPLWQDPPTRTGKGASDVDLSKIIRQEIEETGSHTRSTPDGFVGRSSYGSEGWCGDNGHLYDDQQTGLPETLLEAA